MPAVRIVAHPVFPPGFEVGDWWWRPASVGLVVGEYSKWLAACFRQGLGDLVSGKLP